MTDDETSRDEREGSTEHTETPVESDDQRSPDTSGGEETPDTPEGQETSAASEEEVTLQQAIDLVEEGRHDEVPERHRERLQSLVDEFDHEQESDENEGSESDTHERLAALEEEVAGLRERIGGNDGHDERLATLEDEMAKVRERLDTDEHEEPGRPAEDIRETVEQQGEALGDLQAEFEDHRAEFEKHRDHAEQERERIRKYALQDFALEVVRVKDSIENTVEFVDLDEEAEDQLELVVDQFEQALERSNVERVDTDGTFDLDRHKVMGETPSEEHDPDEIVRTEKAGYRLHDRVIRPAEVVIAASD